MPQPFDRNRVQDAYRTYLGRAGGDEELNTHMGNPGGLEGIIGTLVTSPEGQAYASRPATPAPSATPASATGALGTAPTGGRRGTFNNLLLDAPTSRNNAAFEGFNTERAAAGGDPNSVKDGVYRWLQGLEFDPRGQSKQQIDDFFTSQIGSARNAGLNILDVNGDQILIETAERGPEWIDFIRNAGGGDDVAYQWLPQQDLGNTDNGGFTDAFAGLRGQAGGGDALSALLMGGTGGSDLLAQIQAKLQELMTGQPAQTPPATIPGLPPGGGEDWLSLMP